MQKLRMAINQIKYLWFDLSRTVNKKLWRWVTIWFSTTPYILVSYRLDRSGYLLFGKLWGGFRLIFFPVGFLFRILGADHDINYRADIGPGLKILHPNLGVVVTGYARIGKKLTLTGGNCIGGREGIKPGNLNLGDNLYLGANSVILGPIEIGDECVIGAGAVVLHNFPAKSVLVGVPAKNLDKNQ